MALKARSEESNLQFNNIHVKLQSVVHHYLSRGNDSNNLSLGQHIDRYIEEERHSGRHPNKLVINLDPPDEKLNQMED